MSLLLLDINNVQSWTEVWNHASQNECFCRFILSRFVSALCMRLAERWKLQKAEILTIPFVWLMRLSHLRWLGRAPKANYAMVSFRILSLWFWTARALKPRSIVNTTMLAFKNGSRFRTNETRSAIVIFDRTTVALQAYKILRLHWIHSSPKV